MDLEQRCHVNQLGEGPPSANLPQNRTAKGGVEAIVRTLLYHYPPGATKDPGVYVGGTCVWGVRATAITTNRNYKSELCQ